MSLSSVLPSLQMKSIVKITGASQVT